MLVLVCNRGVERRYDDFHFSSGPKIAPNVVLSLSLVVLWLYTRSLSLALSFSFTPYSKSRAGPCQVLFLQPVRLRLPSYTMSLLLIQLFFSYPNHLTYILFPLVFKIFSIKNMSGFFAICNSSV